MTIKDEATWSQFEELNNENQRVRQVLRPAANQSIVDAADSLVKNERELRTTISRIGRLLGTREEPFTAEVEDFAMRHSSAANRIGYALGISQDATASLMVKMVKIEDAVMAFRKRLERTESECDRCYGALRDFIAASNAVLDAPYGDVEHGAMVALHRVVQRAEAQITNLKPAEVAAAQITKSDVEKASKEVAASPLGTLLRGIANIFDGRPQETIPGGVTLGEALGKGMAEAPPGSLGASLRESAQEMMKRAKTSSSPGRRTAMQAVCSRIEILKRRIGSIEHAIAMRIDTSDPASRWSWLESEISAMVSKADELADKTRGFARSQDFPGS